MSGSVVSALNIKFLYEICPWMQTWFHMSAQSLLDQKDLIGSGEHFGYWYRT